MKTWVYVIYKTVEKKIVFSLSVRKINALSDTANQNKSVIGVGGGGPAGSARLKLPAWLKSVFGQ